MIEQPYKTFTCTYPFNGSTWGFDIKARSHDEAISRLKAIGWGKVDGEVIMRIDAETNASIHPVGAVPDPIERGFLAVASGVFRVLNGYVRLRNWLVRS